MAKKGSDKNTKNKAIHSKLMDRKLKKIKEEKLLREERMRLLKEKIKQMKS